MLSVASSTGIDIGKQYLDVGFFPAAKPLRAVNEPIGIGKIHFRSSRQGRRKSRPGGDRLLWAKDH
jgi:hypothetical protein